MKAVEKATLTCKCGHKNRIPILNKTIKFNCAKCKLEHIALLGCIVEEEVSPIEDKKANPWKVVSGVLALLLIGFILYALKGDQKSMDSKTNVDQVLVENKKERVAGDQFLSELIANLKSPNSKKIAELKGSLTPDSQVFFEMFVENQYAQNDSVSTVLLNEFFESLELLPIRVIRYNGSEKFSVSLIDEGELFLLDIDFNDFLR